MPVSLTTILTSLAALAAVLGLVLLAGRAARATSFARLRQNQRLAVRESVAIDRNRSLRIVSCDGRELLLLVGGTDLVIGWLPAADGRPEVHQ
jgi:flagellar biogenesis protein FliO